MGEKSPQNANKPNTKCTGQTAFKKAKFQLFGLEKCQKATLALLELGINNINFVLALLSRGSILK